MTLSNFLLRKRRLEECDAQAAELLLSKKKRRRVESTNNRKADEYVVLESSLEVAQEEDFDATPAAIKTSNRKETAPVEEADVRRIERMSDETDVLLPSSSLSSVEQQQRLDESLLWLNAPVISGDGTSNVKLLPEIECLSQRCRLPIYRNLARVG